MIQVFAGYDLRESAGYHAFCQSVIDTCTEPVSIAPISLKQFKRFYREGQRDGTNEFIYSRFLVPYLMGYSGWALFVDGADMVCRGDLSELWALRDPTKAVQVVKHEYLTQHPRKYIGTGMEADNADYEKKNWSSVMLINCGHPEWRQVDPAYVARSPGWVLHRFGWMQDRYVGELPMEWNWLSQEYGVNPQAKLVHYTVGIPAFKHYENTEHADWWRKAHERATYVAG